MQTRNNKHCENIGLLKNRSERARLYSQENCSLLQNDFSKCETYRCQKTISMLKYVGHKMNNRNVTYANFAMASVKITHKFV